jgi:charged multivesicular body protein 4
MSLFTKIFGKNAKEKPPTPQEAIQRIREVEELLGKKSEFLEKKIDQELDVARKHGTKNKRCM